MATTNKKVYIITETSQSNHNYEFTISDIRWVFTSAKKANEQMSRLSSMIQEGIWWRGADFSKLPSKVLHDQTTIGFRGIIRDILAETPNGRRVTFRLQEVETSQSVSYL